MDVVECLAVIDIGGFAPASIYRVQPKKGLWLDYYIILPTPQGDVKLSVPAAGSLLIFSDRPEVVARQRTK